MVTNILIGFFIGLIVGFALGWTTLWKVVRYSNLQARKQLLRAESKKNGVYPKAEHRGN